MKPASSRSEYSSDAAHRMRPAVTGPSTIRTIVSAIGARLLRFAGAAASALVVEEVINSLRQFRVDAVDQFQFRQRRPRYPARRAEAVEQRAFARRPNAADLVQRILRDIRFALAAMGADG